MRLIIFFFSSRRRHTSSIRDWSSDVCSSDLTGIIWERARGHLVVGAGPLRGLAGLQFVQGEIDSAATIVPRTLRGIGDEDFALGRRCVPENFRYVPGAIGVVDKQGVAQRFEPKQCTQQGGGGGALEKGARLRVDRRAEEIVGGGVANIVMDAGVERCQVDEVGLPELAILVRRRGSQRFLAKVFYRARELYAEGLAFFRAERPAWKREVAERNACGAAFYLSAKVDGQRRARGLAERESPARRALQVDFRTIAFAQHQPARFFQHHE